MFIFELLTIIWALVCLYGALAHGSYMDIRHEADVRYSHTPMVRHAWYLASLIHMVMWTVVLVVPVVLMYVVPMSVFDMVRWLMHI